MHGWFPFVIIYVRGLLLNELPSAASTLLKSVKRQYNSVTTCLSMAISAAIRSVPGHQPQPSDGDVSAPALGQWKAPSCLLLAWSPTEKDSSRMPSTAVIIAITVFHIISFLPPCNGSCHFLRYILPSSCFALLGNPPFLFWSWMMLVCPVQCRVTFHCHYEIKSTLVSLWLWSFFCLLLSFRTAINKICTCPIFKRYILRFIISVLKNIP